MLKRLLLLGAFLGTLSCTSLQATTTFQLNPLDGAISGKPGSTIGWGFNLSNDENFLVVTSVLFEPDTALGTFTDFISAANFFVVGPANSGSTVWAQTFNAGLQTGVGSFFITPDTAIGSVANGDMVLTYDLFSRSPLDVNFNPNTDTLSNGNVLTATASVTVSPVPEPQTYAMLLAGLGLLGFVIHRRKDTTL